MTARTSLTTLLVASTALTLLLSRTCLDAATTLAGLDARWWGPSQLSDALLTVTAGLGAAAALWHAASAALALASLLAPTGRAATLGATALRSWGAPLARRALAGALVASAVSGPALAAEAGAVPDDLGWRPTASTSASPSPSPSTADADADATADADAESLSTGPSTVGAPAGPPPAPAAREHVVLPGESLWSITEQALGDQASPADVACLWPELYRLNEEAVGPSPDLIVPGTVLTLPSTSPAP